jgi:ANTAR domain/GAF domain
MIAAREPGRQADLRPRTSPKAPGAPTFASGERLPPIYTYRMARGPLAGSARIAGVEGQWRWDMSQEAFGAELRTFRAGLQAFHRRVTEENGTTPADPAWQEQLLAELESALEGLRASEEELDARAMQLDGIQQALDDERRRWQRWFDTAPVSDIQGPRPGGKAGWEHGALNRLLAATIESTPALLRVDAAGLLMVDGGGVLRPVVATDRGVATIETLQVDLDEGPAVEAARQVAPVWTDDLEADVRWQRLGWVAASYRSRGVLAVPVLADEDDPGDTTAAGVVELVWFRRHRWSDKEVEAAVVHGATVSRLLRLGLAAERSQERAERFRRTQNNRVVVEQAKGMLMERNRLLPAQAFQLLRTWARISHRRIADVAADVIADRSTDRPRRDDR